jgi:hypothetical protein
MYQPLFNISFSMLIFGMIAGFTKLQLQIKFLQLLLLILLCFAGELSKTAVWGSYHIAVKSIIFVGMKVADYIFHQTSPSFI